MLVSVIRNPKTRLEATSSVQHILTKFFLAKNQKIKHLQFQIRIPHGIRRSPHPFSSQSDTSFARYGPLSVEVWGKLTFGDGSTITAKLYSFEKPLQSAAQGSPDNLWPGMVSRYLVQP